MDKRKAPGHGFAAGAFGMAAVLSATLASAGQPLWMTDGIPVCLAPFSQVEPQAASDGLGGAYIAWVDYRSDSTEAHSDVYVQRLDASGTALWPADGVVASSFSGGAYDLQLVADGTGGAVVAWAESDTFDDVYLRRLDGTGSPLWPAPVEVSALAVDQLVPRIAADGTGGVIVAWADFRSGTADIYAQRLDPSGAASWTTDGVPLCTQPGTQIPSALVPDGAGGAIAVWVDDRRVGPSGPDDDIYAQRVDPSGAVLWTADGAPVCKLPGQQGSVDAAADGSGGAFVTWSDLRVGPASDIFASRVGSGGAPLWSRNGVQVCGAPGLQRFPRIAADGSGGAIIVWRDNRVQEEVYARRVDGAGVPLWTPDGVLVSTTFGGTSTPVLPSPRVIADGSGGAVVLWTTDRNGNHDPCTQRVDANGTALWAPGGVTVTEEPTPQLSPALASDGSGGAIVVWGDWRNSTVGSTDIYAQRMGTAPTGVVEEPAAGRGGTLSVSHAPQPAAGSLTLRIELAYPAPAGASLELFDVAGRRLQSRDLGALPAGTSSFEVELRGPDGRSLPRGTYFYRLSTASGFRTGKVVTLR